MLHPDQGKCSQGKRKRTSSGTELVQEPKQQAGANGTFREQLEHSTETPISDNDRVPRSVLVLLLESQEVRIHVLHCTAPRRAAPRRTTLRHAAPRRTTPHDTAQCRAAPRRTACTQDHAGKLFNGVVGLLPLNPQRLTLRATCRSLRAAIPPPTDDERFLLRWAERVFFKSRCTPAANAKDLRRSEGP